MSVGQGLNVGWLPDIATCLRLRKRQTNKTADEFITVDMHPQCQPGRVHVTRLCKSTGLQLLTGRSGAGERVLGSGRGRARSVAPSVAALTSAKEVETGRERVKRTVLSAFATRSGRVRQSRCPSQNKR